MKIDRLLVNWSLFDEELLEPYEWVDDDDLEVLNDVSVYRVEGITMNDFFNNVVTFKHDFFENVFILACDNYSICIEIDKNNELKYRSVLTYEIRSKIEEEIDNLEILPVAYKIDDYCELKEYGLSREERVKKQYLIQKIELLYLYQPSKLVDIYEHIFDETKKEVGEIYQYFLLHVNSKYRFLHEYLYKIFYLV